MHLHFYLAVSLRLIMLLAGLWWHQRGSLDDEQAEWNP